MKYKLFALLLSSFALGSNANSAEKISSEIHLEFAQKITAKALECGKKNNWKISVAVVNAEGNLVSFSRADGAYLGSVEVSIEKAKSSNAFQRPTKAFVDGVKAGNLGLLSVKGAIAIEGGLPIVLNGVHAGGIGVSGAKAAEDELCAKAALE